MTATPEAIENQKIPYGPHDYETLPLEEQLSLCREWYQNKSETNKVSASVPLGIDLPDLAGIFQSCFDDCGKDAVLTSDQNPSNVFK